MTASVAFVAGFGSSIDAPVIPQAAKEFHVSEETESLATVLFLVGFGAGAPFAGPLSETFGRNPIYLGTLLLFCCWILGSALSPNFGAQLAFMFLAGSFGSTAFTTAGGTLVDVFDHQQRGKIFPWFGAVALFGPMISPVVGGYVGESGLDWRWVEWITLCIAGGLFVTMLLFLPETYAPVRPFGWSATDVSGAEDRRSALPADLDPLDRAYHIRADGLPDVRLHGFVLVLLRRAVHLHSILRVQAGSSLPHVPRSSCRVMAVCAGISNLRNAHRARVPKSCRQR